MTNVCFGLCRNHNPDLCPIKRIEKYVVLARQMSIDLTTVCLFRPTTPQRGFQSPILSLLPLRLADTIPNNIYSLRLDSTTVFFGEMRKKFARNELRGYFFTKSSTFHQMRSKLSGQAFEKNILCRHLGFKFFL